MSKSTKCWSLVKSNGVCPTARSGHSAVVAKESLYIFGGCGHPAVKCASRSPTLSSIPDGELDREAMPVCLGDLHVYDLARQSWSEVIPKDLSVVPAERTCAAMCTSEEEDRLFLSGGAGDNPNDLRADLLEFDVRQCTWRLLFDGSGSTSYSACRRIGHAMVHDSARNRLIVFGGSTGECNGMRPNGCLHATFVSWSSGSILSPKSSRRFLPRIALVPTSVLEFHA